MQTLRFWLVLLNLFKNTFDIKVFSRFYFNHFKGTTSFELLKESFVASWKINIPELSSVSYLVLSKGFIATTDSVQMEN